MGNEKLDHFYRLVELCSDIQSEILSEERSALNDFIIINIYSLVSEFPQLPISDFERIYQYLRSFTNVTGGSENVKIPIPNNRYYTISGFANALKSWWNCLSEPELPGSKKAMGPQRSIPENHQICLIL